MAKKVFNAREITFQIEKTTWEDVGETAFAILRNLIFASPVGDPTLWQNPESAPPGYVGGHFRRNWLVSLGVATETEVEGEDVGGAQTAAAGKAVIDGWAQARRRTNLFIVNNVPYANRLADGWSTQAEPGWVDDAIDLGLTVPGGTKDLP